MQKQKTKLTEEEIELEEGALAGAKIKAPQKRLDQIQAIAQATLDERKKAVNIRIAPDDIEALKAKASEQGLGYQTLMASVLHRYVNGTLVDSSMFKALLESIGAAREQISFNTQKRKAASTFSKVKRRA